MQSNKSEVHRPLARRRACSQALTFGETNCSGIDTLVATHSGIPIDAILLHLQPASILTIIPT